MQVKAGKRKRGRPVKVERLERVVLPAPREFRVGDQVLVRGCDWLSERDVFRIRGIERSRQRVWVDVADLSGRTYRLMVAGKPYGPGKGTGAFWRRVQLVKVCGHASG